MELRHLRRELTQRDAALDQHAAQIKQIMKLAGGETQLQQECDKGAAAWKSESGAEVYKV